MRPNFLVIGSMRCATTSLCELLRKHPDVFTDPQKETHFFSIDRFYDLGWPWYEARFEQWDGEHAIGEGSTTYTQHHEFPKAADRVIEHLPDVRLIYIVRDPLEQLESHWLLRLSHGRGIYPFVRAIRKNPTYLDTARYWSQLERYRRHFPDERILVLFMEDFVADSKAVLRQCFELLGVDPDFVPDDPDRKRNKSSQRLVDTRLLTTLKHSAGIWRLFNALPSGAQAFLNRKLRVPGDFRPKWTGEARRWAADQLAEDSARILAHAGKPPDFWDARR